MGAKTTPPATKINIDTLVLPYTTRKTRRTIARAFQVPIDSPEQTELLKTLTLGQLHKKLPTFQDFKDFARQTGPILDNTLEKIKPLYELPGY